ncbi:MAG: hypothetical protein MUE59_13160 [Thiobacillaceae bacterium]|jgi:hypothetical protein|nr:hypothetical protein [Thiobacillaceae bacterium]
MAGDWIKLRIDLHEDPAVIAIAADLDISELEVVGCLYRIWAWADQQTTDGQLTGVTAAWIDRLIHREKFAAAMQKVGWLMIKKTGIQLPHFDRHNGKSAKERALATERKRQERSRSCHGDDVTKAGPEKRREEKRKEEEKKAPRRASPPADRRSAGARLEAAPATPTAGEVEDKTPRPPPGLRQLASILRQVRPPDPEVEAARAELDAKKPIPIPGEAQEVA